MNYQIEKKGDVFYALNFRFEPEDIRGEIEKVCTEIGKTAKVPGFRPGKAPVNIIKKYYRETIREHLMAGFVLEKVKEVLEKENLNLVSEPAVEDVSLDLDGNAMEVSIVVEVKPEIELSREDYAGIKVRKTAREITDADVDKVVEGLRNQAVVWREVDREARAGDLVELEYTTTTEGKEPQKGTTSVVLGQKQLWQEIEENILGKKAGYTGTAVVKLSEGKEAKVDFTVKSIKEKELPEVNDEFAKRFGFESVDEMRKKIREDLEVAEETKKQEEIEEQIVSTILKKVKVPVPPSLLALEVRAQVEAQLSNLARFGIAPSQVNPETLSQIVGPLAEKTVKVKLLLEKVAELEDIKVSDEDVEQEVQRLADTAFNGDYVKARQSLESKGLMNMVRLDILRQKALDRLIELAEIETVSEESQREPEQEQG